MSSNTSSMKATPPEESTPPLSSNHADESFFADGIVAKRGLPPYLDHFNARDMKILFKSSVAVWIMTLLIFINPTLNYIGQATFFGAVILVIIPPSGVVLLYILAVATICIGLALGWAWGTITMKAALAARPQSDITTLYIQLQQAIAQGTIQASGKSSAVQVAIYNGFMLDTRSRLRGAAPKLALVSLFAMIIADVYLTTATLIPTFQGTLPKAMLLPVAIGIGIGLVCNILIFPQTTSTIVLEAADGVLSAMPGFVEIFVQHLHNPKRRLNTQRLERLNLEMSRMYKNADMSFKFLPMDFSYGYWGPSDIGSLQQPLQEVFVKFMELVQLSLQKEQSRTKQDALIDVLEDSVPSGDILASKFSIASYHITKAFALHNNMKHPETEKLLLQTSITLGTFAAPLLEACASTICLITRTLQYQSGKKANLAIQMDDNLKQLRKAGDDFKVAATKQLFEPYSHLFNDDGELLHYGGLDNRKLLVFLLGLLYQERIINFSDAVASLLERIQKIEAIRQHKRPWAPKTISKLLAWGISQEANPSNLQSSFELRRITTAASTGQILEREPSKSGDSHETPRTDLNDAKSQLDSMRLSRSRPRKMAGQVFLAAINWLTNADGIHAARTVLLTVALAVPAVIPASSGFYYREKGLWALIMGQMALVPYTSDFISGLLIRLGSTILGGIIGLVCWYIGAGSGPGNPYGMAAVMAVIIVAIMWYRLFAPPEMLQAGIMMTTTIYLVVAYSWSDTHNPVYGNPGVGYNVFWRRLLLVLVGFAASLLVMFFPRPPSGSEHYREFLSGQLCSIKERYALFISTWKSQPSDLIEVVESEALSSQEALEASLKPIEHLRYEFSSNNVDSATMLQVCKSIVDMNAHITQLVTYTNRLSPEQRSRFMYATGAAHESFVADLMAVVTLIENSLISGKPLPAIMPAPLLNISLSMQRVNRDDKSSGDHRQEQVTPQDTLMGESGRLWASSIYAYVSLMMRLDGLVLVLKKAVGEESRIDLGALV
ncbi:hypothetical protein E8E14_001560 [Neopestalotiopsis sp. 37M]|nr:hypothetical protein E8E14_001560 [Neopestalotiopsis sp. 37M]